MTDLKISNKNIRATALTEFWGDQFSDSIYLWEGAKNNLTLSEIEKLTVPTLSEQFPHEKEVHEAFEYSKKTYLKFLPLITEQLNQIHQTKFPERFWSIAFGYWLFRHICITYEKYVYLSKLDIDKTSIKLLDKGSFYFPDNHNDFYSCFTNDFGVQQLVSHYYYLFKKKDFSVVKKEFVFENDEAANKNVKQNHSFYRIAKRSLKQILFFLSGKSDKPQMVLCNVFYTNELCQLLYKKSDGLIQRITCPSQYGKSQILNKKGREKLTKINTENNYEYFMVQALSYTMPKAFIENFKDYYNVCLKDIKSRKFKSILSEDWISFVNTSIYVAIAHNLGKHFISNEHGAGNGIFKTSRLWNNIYSADIFITTGWKSTDSKIIQGGFATKKVIPYSFDNNKKDILFISHVRPPYLIEFTGCNLANTHYLNEVRMINDFIEKLPSYLQEYFVFRPRKAIYFWDTEKILEIEKRNIRTDSQDFSESILNSRLVIIDHFTTGFHEIIASDVPFMVLFDSFGHLSDDLNDQIERLKKTGVFHSTVDSLIKKIVEVYSDVHSWWTRTDVTSSVTEFRTRIIAEPSKTVDYLLSWFEKE
jgi:putative transferase (TIGR04331 family)